MIAKLDNEISKLLRRSAVVRDNKKTGKTVLSFVERNQENTRSTSYIQVLGNNKLKENEINGGYRTNKAGRKI